MEGEKILEQLEIPGCYLLAGKDGIILQASEMAWKDFSEPKDTLTGANITDLVTEPDKEVLVNFLADDERTGRHVRHSVITFLTRKGERRSAHLYGIHAGGGMPLILAYLDDRHLSRGGNSKGTDQDEILQEKLDHEMELNEIKSRFLSIASHEFKTPLTGILSSLNLIDRYIHSDSNNWMNFKNHENVANHLKKIHESANNLSNTLNKFLSLDNIEKGEIPVRYNRFDLKRVLETQKSQFLQSCKPGQNIHYLHKSRKSRVSMDKYLLRNIMNNLISNAIKYSPFNTSIRLLSEITEKEVRIEVSDEGMGIPAGEQEKVFRRFYRAENALAAQDGTGLGLSIVQRYVGLMNGTIEVNSIENEGTTFILTFPNKIKDEEDTGD